MSDSSDSPQERIREQARLLDLAREAILVCDLSGAITYWNDGAKRIYGWTAGEVVGRKVDELLAQDPGRCPEVTAAVLADDEWAGEIGHRTKDGRAILVDVRLTLVRDPAGRPKSVLAINSDITGRKKLEAQLVRAQRMECIGTLASGIAHDLNNVLTPIMTACQLLAIPMAEEDRGALLDILNRSAQRGAELVRQVLSFCRGVESRRIELSVRPLIQEIRHIAAQTFPKTIRIETRAATDLWPVLADPTQLHQVLLNLCINARDAMPTGGVLAVAAENTWLEGPPDVTPGTTGPQPWIVISVTDTGVGIPPELREKIFDPFFTTKDVGKGTGLGLSTSLAIAKSHGGFISVYSEPGQGSAFRIYLPALPSGSTAPLGGEAAHLPRGEGELVLVVDDEEAIRAITQRTLESYGYRVITARDGAEAVQLHQRHSAEVAAILMDMTMPVMDGPATIHALHRHHPELRIIAASGLSPEAHVSRCPPNAISAFLSKPYTAEALLTTLHDLLHP